MIKGDLYAFWKNREKEGFHKIKQDVECLPWDEPIFSNALFFDPNNQSKCLFFIQNFSEKNCFNHRYSKVIDSGEVTFIQKKYFQDVKYFCILSEGRYYFQHATRSQKLINKYFVTPKGIDSIEDRIQINSTPDCVYDVANDTLYFYSIQKVNTIFVGIKALYVPKDSFETFLDDADIPFSYDAGNKCFSEKTKFMLNDLAKFYTSISKGTKGELRDEIRKVIGNRIQYDNNERKYTPQTEKELQIILYGLQRRIITTRTNTNKMVAIEITTIENFLKEPNK